MGAIRWLGGNAALRPDLAPILGSLDRAGPAVVVREKSGRRRLLRAPLAGDGSSAEMGGSCFIKQFAARRPGRGPVRWLREWAKRRLGLTTDQREWRALVRLHAAGVAVPEPLAHAELASGDRVLVTRYVEGCSLAEALNAPRRERDALLRAVGELVARFHTTGFVHRDLHRENLWVGKSGPLLLDLQLTLPRRSQRARLADLGELDRSLERVVPLTDRVRLRAAALGLSRPFGAAARAALREVAAAAGERARAHYRSRTRRTLRAGRLYAPIGVGSAAGLRWRDTPEAAIHAAIAEAPATAGTRRLARTDGGLEVRTWAEPGWLGAFGAALHGSPARRAWRGGHGLRARHIEAVVPLAFVEWRRFGLPFRSALVTEAVEPRLVLADAAPLPGLAQALTALLCALHGRGACHDRLDARALDIEDVPEPCACASSSSTASASLAAWKTRHAWPS